ncbi:MAG: response regulator [Planctomycetota bacterium]|jgi:two-component system cell cycle response regulator|nr:response regulator [Planctomycetota bacterium]MDP6762414.1 response regulator [Planctomycetota bacterium]MDP6989550.1 response regulator [Planctomycetota bacterium]
MRLDEMTPAHVRRAVALYMERAWPRPAETVPIFDPTCLEEATTLDQLFALCRTPEAEDGAPAHSRYTMRLGNERYPFMKLVIQEYLIDGEFFLSVDTHDDHIDVAEDSPEHAQWQDLKSHNRALKEEIELAWHEGGLPTHRDLRALAEGLARVEREGEKRAHILVVDDEQQVAAGIAALLEGRGYTCECFHDGREVLERLALDPLPDLVLLDYAMPELDGEQVLARLRAEERTERLPVLMATASSIRLERLQRVSGFLRKPYPRELLFTMLERLLASDEA